MRAVRASSFKWHSIFFSLAQALARAEPGARKQVSWQGAHENNAHVFLSNSTFWICMIKSVHLPRTSLGACLCAFFNLGPAASACGCAFCLRRSVCRCSPVPHQGLVRKASFYCWKMHCLCLKLPFFSLARAEPGARNKRVNATSHTKKCGARSLLLCKTLRSYLEKLPVRQMCSPGYEQTGNQGAGC